LAEKKGLIFDIKRDCSEDGPGIRTTIFFKGCPLSCIWCHNPEGISPKPSIAYTPDRCDPTECDDYPCLKVCLPGALTINRANKKISVSHNACTRCDKCFEACTLKALEPAGNWWAAKDLADKILIDKEFFKSTGGGVTISGGEPCRQMEFLHDFLVELYKEGIHVGLETSGMFALKAFLKNILPFLDFIYFDLKLIDSQESRKYTGCSNERILKNFLFLVRKSKIPVIPRIPLIPGITAEMHNLAGIAQFLKKHGVTACSLMPYNPLWQDKSVKHGIEIKYSRPAFMTKVEEENCAQCFLSSIDRDCLT
jgi:pyruvate formate lyase activating enzyme